MRVFIVIVLLLLILGLVGWIQFSSPDGNPTIRVDTGKVKEDTAVIVEKSKQAVDHAAETIDASNDPDPVDQTPIEP